MRFFFLSVYMKTSTRVGYAPPVWKRAQVDLIEIKQGKMHQFSYNFNTGREDIV